MRFLIINGPNLNLLGKRDPRHYGGMTLKGLNSYVRQKLRDMGIGAKFFQSGYEGDIIKQLHSADNRFDGVLLNAGAFTHYSYAIRDAVEAISVPVCEVHLSDISLREEFRRFSVLTTVVKFTVKGLKQDSYVHAARQLKEYIESGGADKT